ncbi:ABC transporter permease, partial [Magnetococcales bacterium HHB-1]
TVSMLPESWQQVALWNPIFYMVDLFRYAIIGYAQGNPHWALLAVLSVFFSLMMLMVVLMRKGWKLKS